MNNSIKHENLPYLLVLLIIGVLYFFIEWNSTPTLSDDVLYHFQFSYDENAAPLPINNLSDLLHSQWVHYNMLNGRLANLLAPVMYILPLNVLHVINTLLFILLIHFSMKAIVAENINPAPLAAICFSVIFLFMSGFKSAMVWSEGSFNYLWVLTANIALFLYVRRIRTEPLSWRHCLLAPLALAAGWGHEALSLPLSVGIAVYTLQNYRAVKRSAALPYFVFYIMGLLLCLASPGIRERLDSDTTIFSRLVNGSVAMLLVARVFWLLLIAAAFAWRKKVFSRKVLFDNAWLMATLLSAYGIVFLSGTAIERVAFHADFIALLCLLCLCDRLFSNAYIRISAIVLSAVSLIVYVPALAMCYGAKLDYLYAERQMRQPGVTLIKTRQYIPRNYIERTICERYVFPFAEYGFYQSYMGFNANDINIRCEARLYGKPSLTFLPEDVVDNIEKDSLAYSDFKADESKKLIIKRIGKGKKVEGVEFVLRKENIDSLHIWQRQVAYKGNSYTLDDNHWAVINVHNGSYLVLTMPLTNIKRRIKYIRIL